MPSDPADTRGVPRVVPGLIPDIKRAQAQAPDVFIMPREQMPPSRLLHRYTAWAETHHSKLGAAFREAIWITLWTRINSNSALEICETIRQTLQLPPYHMSPSVTIKLDQWRQIWESACVSTLPALVHPDGRILLGIGTIDDRTKFFGSPIRLARPGRPPQHTQMSPRNPGRNQ